MRHLSGSHAGLLAVVCAAALAACQAGEHTGAPRAAAPLVVLAIPDRANENVSLTASGDVVVATWSAAPDPNSEDIFAAVSVDHGATFGGPVRVNAVAGAARVNGEQPPRAAIVDRPGSAPEIFVLWIASAERGTKFLAARSHDGGRTFQEVALPAGVNAQGNRGWETIGSDSNGGIHVAWLDHRRLAPPSDGTPVAQAHAHGHHAASPDMDTVAMAQLSDLYFASLASDEPPRALTAGVCYCCKTAMAHGPDGVIHLAWRHVYEGDMRDIAFTTSRDRGRTFGAPVRVHEDAWSIKGCPDDGPAMTVDAEGRVHLVWPTMVVGQTVATKIVRYSMTSDGQTFTAPVALPSRGHAHHPQIAVTSDGTLAVAWDEVRDDGRFVARARGKLDSAGRVTFTRDAEFVSTGMYPTLTTAGDRLMMAWVSEDSGTRNVIKIERWR
jgi:hypothetical protein